jgi:TetR/AcrR family transcriptional regulator
MPETESLPPPVAEGSAPVRKRPKPGERRVQILQTLAVMLEQPGSERITTASLAAKLDVSEAALYRHFASKAQMFEGLIEFIEQSVFTLINQITSIGPLDAAPDASAPAEDEADTALDPALGRRQAQRILTMLLQFAEKNPGMTRVMVGDALVFENDRLQLRMNQFFDKIEASLRQCLRQPAVVNGSATPSVDAQVRASMLTSFALGRLQRFARSGFKRWPTEHLEASLALLI